MKPGPVCQPGDFIFAATGLEHPHIYGQCEALIEAGGEMRWVYDPDSVKVASFCAKFPQVKAATSLDAILDDDRVKLVTAAAIPDERGSLGCRIMQAGKDYFTDKTPFTCLQQLGNAREVCSQTGRKYMVYYSERLHSECAVYAGLLVEQGAIGRVVQVIGIGPHRVGTQSRPSWFFEKRRYGGILCDIGSHQSEQFLFFTGAKDARIAFSAVANHHHPQHPELEDFGEASLVGDNGTTGYYRVDWLTPSGLRTWGDGRTIILGTKGFIELRKYVDLARETIERDTLYLVNEQGEQRFSCANQIGFPFFGQFILDCLNRTENAMTQSHAFKAAELCLMAQIGAKLLTAT